MAWIGPTSGDPFSAGVRAGLDRAGRHDDLRESVDSLEALLSEAPGPPEGAGDFGEAWEWSLGFTQREGISGRFTELFAEMLTVALIARHAYREPALTASQIESYLNDSYTWFNSFRHA